MNLNNYGRNCHIMEAQIGNIREWVWPIQDTQTFPLIVHDWFNGIRPTIIDRHGSKKEGAVIQAGGNCGVYPLLYTEFFNHVYTFEPDPINFYCLTANCQIPGIVKFNCALSDKNDLVTIKENSSVNRGMNAVESTADRGSVHSVPAVTIDSFEFEDVRLIQLDLEGYEGNAILGARRTIEKFKPMIILEWSDEHARVLPEQYEEVKGIMTSINYKVAGQITNLDTLFVPQEIA